MSVRVNLLPRETYAQQAAVRQRNMILLGALALLLVLGLLYWWQVNRVQDARAERDQAQEQLQALERREAQLAEFGDLQQRVTEADETIAAAYADELSYAGILQDVAAVMPTDSALDEFEIVAVEDAGPDGDAAREIEARIRASGESLLGHAPGLERLLLQFDKIASFFDVYFTESVVEPEEDEDVAMFTFEVDVGDEARTGRYESGVPEELR
jgi:hypothetical protein